MTWINGSKAVNVDDVMGNIVESLYNYIVMNSNEMESLAKHLEDDEHKYEVFKQ